MSAGGPASHPLEEPETAHREDRKLVVPAEPLPDEAVAIAGPVSEPAEAPSEVDAASEQAASEEETSAKKVRRLWWRKRAGRSRSAAGKGSTGEGGKTS